MDLIPKPDQVVSAAGNVAHALLYGGLADLRRMPRTLIDEGLLRQVYHYRPAGTSQERGDPVLLVTPLAAPATCFDLRRGCSLVEHLVTEGHSTYLVEYGEVAFRDRGLGMEHWIDEVLPEAIRATSEHAGGRPVHLIGWSLGGIFAALATADRADLPVASLTVLGSPIDTTKVPLIAPLRPLVALTDLPIPGLKQGLGPVTRAYQVLGGAPKPIVRWAFRFADAQKVVTKPLVRLQHLDDTDFLAQLEAVDDFSKHMIAYPGRTFGQLYHRFVKANALLDGTFDLGDRTIDLGRIKAPVLVFAGATDGIAPIESVRPLVRLLKHARDVVFEVVPGGHLGMLTGRAARETTWPTIDGWLRRWASEGTAAEVPADTGSGTQPTAPRSRPGSVETIGANPARRYGSSSSRGL